MEKRSRHKFTSSFKAKVVLDALQERETIEELSRRYEVHPSEIARWKREAVSKLASVFGNSQDAQSSLREDQREKLYAQIGQLKVENDFLKKKAALMPLSQRRTMIEGNGTLSKSRQCRLLHIHRSGVYYRPCPESDENLAVMRLLDQQYFTTPFYGVRRLAACPRRQGYHLNHKRIRRLMGIVGSQTLYRRPKT